MRVGELIEKLKEFDPSLRVCYTDDDKHFEIKDVDVEEWGDGQILVVDNHEDGWDSVVPAD